MRYLFFWALLLLSFTLSAQRTLTATEMQADLSILHDAWISLHPGLYRFNTSKDIERKFEVLRQQCTIASPEKRFFLLLSQLAQQVKCGHTYLNPLNLDSEISARIMPGKVVPFFFKIVGQEHLIITHVLQETPAYRRGDEVLSINGISVRRILDSLLSVSRSDGNNSLGKKYFNINETPDEAEEYSLFDIYFPLFFPCTDQWSLKIRSFAGKTIRTCSVSLLDLKSRSEIYRQRFGNVPAGEQSWDYHLINETTTYMKFGTFAFWNSRFNTRRYVDSIFADVMSKAKVSNLIIDIRNNEGGDNTGNYILSYITRQKLGCDDPDHRCFRFLTVPDSLLPYLSTWDKSFKAPKDPSHFFINKLNLYEQKKDHDDCAYITPKERVFKGKVYLLINAKNSSAGYEMARNFKMNQLGTVVGETTGGSQQGINGGQFFFLTLPNSHFEIDLPLIYNYHPDKPDCGITPDFSVPDSQSDIYKNRDAQIAFCLDLINAR